MTTMVQFDLESPEERAKWKLANFIKQYGSGPLKIGAPLPYYQIPKRAKNADGQFEVRGWDALGNYQIISTESYVIDDPRNIWRMTIGMFENDWMRLKQPPALAHVFDESWTWQEHLTARKGGWYLDNEDGWSIRKSVHAPTFDSDEQARAFVEMLCDNGNELAARACARVMRARLTGA